MNRKIMLILAGISLLAATSCLRPSQNRPISPNQTFDGFTLVRLHPQDGDLQTMLATEAQKAIALGYLPVVYFDATWCPPCWAIADALDEKNQLMLDAYNGTYIIKLDADEWGWADGHIENFEVEGIPTYFKLDADGQQTGDVINGGAWGEDIPENIAPVLDDFFHRP